MKTKASVQRGEYEYAVYDDMHRFIVTRQPVNPKTGKVWQAKTHLGQFDTLSQALFAWTKIVNNS